MDDIYLESKLTVFKWETTLACILSLLGNYILKDGVQIKKSPLFSRSSHCWKLFFYIILFFIRKYSANKKM